MTSWVIVILEVLAACVLLAAVAAVRDVRVARWTQADPRVDRQARRDAARKVRQQGGRDA